MCVYACVSVCVLHNSVCIYVCLGVYTVYVCVSVSAGSGCAHIICVAVCVLGMCVCAHGHPCPVNSRGVRTPRSPAFSPLSPSPLPAQPPVSASGPCSQAPNSPAPAAPAQPTPRHPPRLTAPFPRATSTSNTHHFQNHSEQAFSAFMHLDYRLAIPPCHIIKPPTQEALKMPLFHTRTKFPTQASPPSSFCLVSCLLWMSAGEEPLAWVSTLSIERGATQIHTNQDRATYMVLLPLSSALVQQIFSEPKLNARHQEEGIDDSKWGPGQLPRKCTGWFKRWSV